MEKSFQQRKSFYKKTRKSKVIKIVQEKYLREDLECGVLLGKPLSASNLKDLVSQALHQQLIVIDTNIAVHQIDVLEYDCPATSLIVICQTVLQEIRHINLSAYKRIINLIHNENKSYIFYPNELSKFTAVKMGPNETINDANDRAIVQTASFFKGSLGGVGDVVFITNDVANKKRALALGLNAKSMRHYVDLFLHTYPVLMDLISSQSEQESTNSSTSNLSRTSIYPNHLPTSDLLSGIKSKKFFKGTIRSSRDVPYHCYIVVHGMESMDTDSNRNPNASSYHQSIQIRGPFCVNRAMEGDTVAVEIIDKNSIETIAAEARVQRFLSEFDEKLHQKTISKEDSNHPLDGVASVTEETDTPSVAMIEGFQTSESKSVATSDDDGQLFGRVVGIIRRDWRQYAGSLDITSIYNADIESDAIPTIMGNSHLNPVDKSNNTTASDADDQMEVVDESVSTVASMLTNSAVRILFIPFDKRIPSIWIRTRRLNELADCRLLVQADEWDATSVFPSGHYVRVLGKNGDKSVETQVLLNEFQVSHEDFSAEVMSCLPPKGWSITPAIIAQRTDIRHIPVVSIDPPGCKDIDDALHCIRLPNGHLQAGVHIADVSYFVHPDTPLDKEAAHRSTSTYLVERRLDMLPGYLTTELCSLRSSEDHLAFSVIWEMDDDANIFDVKFFKSVIRSVASLTYDAAQTMLDEPGKVGLTNLLEEEAMNPVVRSVKLLNQLARILRKRRIDSGALTLASPEVRFKLDAETQNPTDVSMYALKEANALVEEWMLIANITVSKQTLRYFPTLSVLRRHQPPSFEQCAPLLSSAASVGIELDVRTSKTLADSLDAAERPDDPYFNKLLRILSTRCMMPAQYFCSGELSVEEWHHYGLAAPIYTHFTSPIRRYADILVHRLLAASIGVIALPAANSDRAKQRDVCSHMNRRHRAAQYIQRASVHLHTLIYFQNAPSIETAYILSLNAERFSVLVPRFGIEGTISWEPTMKGLAIESNEFDSVKHTMKFLRKESSSSDAQKTVLTLQVFDRVQISIKVKLFGGSNERKLIISLLVNGVEME